MRDLGSAIESEAVLAFLQAEIDSPRFAFRHRVSPEVAALIDKPTLGDPTQDAIRQALLQEHRGFGANAYLFAGWPPGVVWRWYEAECGELGAFLYAKHPSWLKLSKGTRRVGDGATNLDVDVEIKGNVTGVIQRLDSGEQFPPLVAAVAPDGRVVLLEGHTRATAYAVAGRPPIVKVIGATAPAFDKWAFY